MLNVGFITYQEAKRTMGFTFEEYLKMGGLYEDVRFNDLNGLRRYIDTAVVQNIVNTVKKNVDLRMDIICKLTEDKIRTIVYCIFVSVIFDNLRVNRLLQTKRIVGLFDYRDEKKKQEALDIISSQFGLVVNKNITEDEIKAVKLVLEEIGVLLKVKNYAGKEEKCYVTNQCISNVFFSQVYFLIQEQIGVELKAEQKDVLFKSIDGEILEAIVMTYISKVIKHKNLQLYYLRNANNLEIDVIVSDLYRNKLFLAEVKKTDNANTAVVKAKGLYNADLDVIIGDAQVLDKMIIYMGNTQTFEKFTEVMKEDTVTLKQIENRCRGLKLIKAESFLTKTDSLLRNLFK